MVNIMDIMQLCRLCLVKDQVNIPIFEEQGDVRQIFLKITACLPVKVSRDDNLPKKICDGCLYKLELLYQFWNTTANAEKQLLSWLSQAGIEPNTKTTDKAMEIVAQSHAHPHSDNVENQIILKQESIDPDLRNDNVNDSLTLETNYVMQQQQLPYESFTFEQSGYEAETSLTETSALIENEVEDEPAPKRRRRAVKAVPIATQESDDENVDDVETMQITKTEEESEEEVMDESIESTSFVGISNTDNEQPGPSGVGKTSTEAPISNTKLSSKWRNRLPEIDIIPLVKTEINSDDNDDDYEIIPRKNSKRSNSKKVRSVPPKKIEYKNPFNYTTGNVKKSSKTITERPAENKNTKWTCMICSEVQPDKDSLITHYEFHKNEKKEKTDESEVLGDYFICHICSKEFTSLRSFTKHTEEHNEKHYSCDECNKTYKNLFQLCLHNFSVHCTDGKYRCTLCDFKTAFKKSLKPHILKHEQEYKYKCDICGKGFLSATWFEEHQNFHTGAMPFVCDLCGKSFPYTRYLVAHKKSVHPEASSDLQIVNECHICKKRFAHKKSLILHVRGHTGENSVLCDMCGKRLSSSEHFKQHFRIHTGYKPHVCGVCGKGFAKKCNLTLHERVHSGEKPYVCKHCSKCFAQRSTLVIHERYHTGERPYVCKLCNKGFVARGLLGVHMKTSCKVIM